MSDASSVSIIITVKPKSTTMLSQMCLVLAVLLLATAMSVEADNSEAFKACLSLANPEVVKCCGAMEDYLKEKEKCNIKPGVITCETAKCMLKEDGLDGDNIDLEKAKQNMDEIVKQHAELKDVIGRVKSRCLEDRRFEIYPSEGCPAASLVLCSYINSLTECPHWNDTDQCKKFAEDAKTCKNAIDSM